MAKNSFTSFADILENGEIELQREVEMVSHRDENTANNRLFVWNYEESDLKDFIELYEVYKGDVASYDTRHNLSQKVMQKINSMIREGYNPIECMLYASKVINLKLVNDKDLQAVLAEKIKDVYIKQEDETFKVLDNILRMWTWVPQLKVVIQAVGLIGDNEELLDRIFIQFAEDDALRTNVFYAFMQNKSMANMERAMKMVMNLRDNNEDAILGKVFRREIDGFGANGMKVVEKYYNNPGMSRSGAKVIKHIMLKANNNMIDSKDELYRNALAKNSKRDDMAYHDFLEDCKTKDDDQAIYLCRFSRPEIGDYLKEKLETEFLPKRTRNTAVISMAILGRGGYKTAETVLRTMERDEECKYSVMAGKIILGNEEAAKQLAKTFSRYQDYELNELYHVLRGATITSYQYALTLTEKALFEQFMLLAHEQRYKELSAFAGNLQMFWDKKLYGMISSELLNEINNFLKLYAKGTFLVPDEIIVSLIEVMVRSYNANIESTLFSLYQNASSAKIKELSFKKLKERQVEAPK